MVHADKFMVNNHGPWEKIRIGRENNGFNEFTDLRITIGPPGIGQVT